MTTMLTRPAPAGRQHLAAPLVVVGLATALHGIRQHRRDLAALDLALAGLHARDTELAADQAIAARMPHPGDWLAELHGERRRVHDAQRHLCAYAALLITGIDQARITALRPREGGPS